MNTEKLINRCIQQKHGAWNEFIRRYQGLIKRSVYYKLAQMNAGSLRSEAEDITQEIFLSIWEKNLLSGIRDHGCLEVWLSKVAKNMTVSYCKKRFRETDRIKYMDIDSLCEARNDPARACELHEMEEILLKGMGVLKHKERRSLDLAIREGEKQREIAEIMGIPENTVSTLVRRAKSKVRNSVEKYCYC